VKLDPGEAAAVVATDRAVEPTAYGLGRHGWVTVSVPSDAGSRRWRELEEWIRTSYSLVAPARLARMALAEDAASGGAARLRSDRPNGPAPALITPSSG
jgi:predicted DNA-binding protein (MmcQ/YjbR family)